MNETQYVRDLAKQYALIANDPKQDEKIKLWQDHYDLKETKPVLYTSYYNYDEYFSVEPAKCTQPFLRIWEMELKKLLFSAVLDHDQVMSPYVTVSAVKACSDTMRWGLPVEMSRKPQSNGAAAFKPSLLEENDLDKLKVPYHRIDEIATMEKYEKINNLIGDILPIHIDRDPALKVWSGDISTDIVKLRGHIQFMMDLYDRPEWVHKILTFMRDGILKVHQEAEEAGDFSSASQGIKFQGQAYSSSTAKPKPNDYGKKRRELFIYMAAQEMTSISGDMFYEFMLQYQIPILEKYRFSAYGCCEDMTNKIDYLKKIKNIKQIAITPFSNVEICAEKIGEDYVTSWRPNPSLVICNGVNEAFVRKYLQEHFRIFKKYKNKVNINLKDIYTFQKKPYNLIFLNKIIKEEIRKHF